MDWGSSMRLWSTAKYQVHTCKFLNTTDSNTITVLENKNSVSNSVRWQHSAIAHTQEDFIVVHLNKLELVASCPSRLWWSGLVSCPLCMCSAAAAGMMGEMLFDLVCLYTARLSRSVRPQCSNIHQPYESDSACNGKDHPSFLRYFDLIDGPKEARVRSCANRGTRIVSEAVREI
mmetsp:Transcript_3339/g.5363  ORF Transcript_3339/g.5363 Transcript_3339/m.5363 type:complete len:175 (-) Transcript_3339:810-1334(-)